MQDRLGIITEQSVREKSFNFQSWRHDVATNRSLALLSYPLKVNLAIVSKCMVVVQSVFVLEGEFVWYEIREVIQVEAIFPSK